MVDCVSGKNPVVIESCEIAQLIRDTPFGPKYQVDSYHKPIIQRLDSEYIIPVPSIEHRQLHQQIWLQSFTVYNGYKDANSAYIDFLTKPTKDKNGEYPSERIRFDIYYDKHYIQPFLEMTEKRIKWARDTDARAREDTFRGLNRNLEEIAVAID